MIISEIVPVGLPDFGTWEVLDASFYESGGAAFKYRKGHMVLRCDVAADGEISWQADVLGEGDKMVAGSQWCETWREAYDSAYRQIQDISRSIQDLSAAIAL